MKKILLLVLVIVFLPVQTAHAQFTVEAPLLESLTTAFGIKQLAAFANQLAETVKSGTTLANQLYQMEQQAEKAARNLARMGEINSWDDFMKWYNRQLYLESETIDTFNNLGLKVGGKHYNFSDMEGMAYAMDDTFVEFWNREFTEEQRRDVWLSAGLTPANYVYVQTWKEKEKNLAKRMLMSSTVQNNEYMQRMIRNNKNLTRLAADAQKAEAEKMDSKELAAITAETAINTNKDINDIKMSLANLDEYLSVRMYKENVPYDEPAMSPWSEKSGFRPMKSGEETKKK
jgi:uncharacterized phage infection (PIP) family protein YhgE